MSEYPEDSVGLVTPQRIMLDEPLTLSCGQTLPSIEVVYETYGKLNAHASNAVLVTHALTGDHHAAGYYEGDKRPGWWEIAIGPGKPIDTNRFFVICMNNIGGCSGSTGPESIDPKTGKPWGPNFPLVTVQDWVQMQHRVLKKLGIHQLAAAVGGSLGGMQILQWTVDLPELVRNAVVIAAAPKLSAQNIAFNEVARRAIIDDPDFHEGNYDEHGKRPRVGLSIARMLGHITYLSDSSMGKKFGRAIRGENFHYNFHDVDFEVESYLRYQGQKFVDRFDANSYLRMTKALDYFDPAGPFEDDLSRAVETSDARFLVLSFTRDWRFSPKRSEEIVKALVRARKNVSYLEVDAELGHDDFLMAIPDYVNTFSAFMQGVEV